MTTDLLQLKIHQLHAPVKSQKLVFYNVSYFLSIVNRNERFMPPLFLLFYSDQNATNGEPAHNSKTEQPASHLHGEGKFIEGLPRGFFDDDGMNSRVSFLFSFIYFIKIIVRFRFARLLRKRNKSIPN